MGRSLDGVMASLPKARRDKVNRRFRELKQEVENLAALREVTGKAQTEVAAALNVSQPSVSKIEKQADVLFSTLRNYVQALGGDLEVVVHLPKREPLRLSGLGDLMPSSAPTKRTSPRKKVGHRV